MTGRCEDCKHWHNNVQQGDVCPDTTGQCRALPPLPDDRNGAARWPFTEDTDSCGKFSPIIHWPRNMRDWRFDDADPRHPNYIPF